MKLLVFALSFSLLWPPLTSAAVTYYVSPIGRDTHSCTQAQTAKTPKKTIQAGFNCASPGDTILVSGGTYAESVTLGKSGQKGKPITLKAKPGDRVIWRGSNADPKKGAVFISQQSFLRIEEFTFEGTTTRTTVLVRNTPKRKETAPVQGIAIINNTFTNNGQRTNDARIIYFISAGHKTFGSEAVQNLIAGNTFRGNYGRNISLLATSDTIVRKNLATNGKGSSRKRDGVYSARFIQIDGEDKRGNNSVRNIIEQNTIYDFVVQPYVGTARNDIQAIKLDANADQNIIRANLIYNLDKEKRKGSEGIFIESRCDDNVVSGNIIYNVGQSCYRDGSKSTYTTLRNQWINNIGYACQCGLSLSNAQGAIVRNNIFALNKHAQVYVTDQSASNRGHSFSNNLYYLPDGGNLNTWNGTATSCRTATHSFSSWISASQDTNSLAADPQFMNPPADFRLQPISPALKSGVAGVDLGAYSTSKSTSAELSAPKKIQE